MHWLVFAPPVLVALITLAALALYLYGRRIPVGHVTAAEVSLRKSPEEVYALIADVPGHTRWAPRVRSITPAEPHEGRPAFRMRVDRQEFFVVVSAAVPPGTFALTVPGDRMFSGVWTWDIARTPTGCTVRLTERGEVYAAFVRGMLRVFGMEAKFLLLNLAGLAKHFGDSTKPHRVA